MSKYVSWRDEDDEPREVWFRDNDSKLEAEADEFAARAVVNYEIRQLFKQTLGQQTYEVEGD